MPARSRPGAASSARGLYDQPLAHAHRHVRIPPLRQPVLLRDSGYREGKRRAYVQIHRQFCQTRTQLALRYRSLVLTQVSSYNGCLLLFIESDSTPGDLRDQTGDALGSQRRRLDLDN